MKHKYHKNCEKKIKKSLIEGKEEIRDNLYNGLIIRSHLEQIFTASSISNLFKYIDINYSKNSIDIKGWHKSHYAALKNNVEELSKIPENELNAVSNDGETPLFLSCASGNLEAVEFFINKGQDLGQERSCGITPFLIAISSGYRDIANLFFDKVHFFPFIDKSGAENMTPLIHAIIHDFPEIVDKLLRFHASLNIQLKSNSYTPIHIACMYNRNKCFDIILKYVSSNTISANIPKDYLHCAAQYSPLCAAKILNNTILCNTGKDKYGLTPYDYAINYGNYPLYKVLSKTNKKSNPISDLMFEKSINSNHSVFEELCKAFSSGILLHVNECYNQIKEQLKQLPGTSKNN